MTLTVAATAVGFLPACSPSVNCTAERRNALIVTVHDFTGAEVCHATVTATDGSFSANLEPAASSPPCPYVGPPERKGTYTVTARVDGQSGSVPNVRVTADQCHVHPVSLTIELRFA